MEKYTFLKFIKIKEKEIKNKIKNLKNQIGGSPPFNLNDILLQIADFENKLSSITSITSAPFMTSYESLKTTIDEINKKIETFKQELINRSITPDDDNILNKIKRIEQFMHPGNYELISKESFSMIKEPVATDNLQTIITTITSQFADKLKKIKDNMKKNKNDGNEDINKTKKEIKKLIEKYNQNISEFNIFKNTINFYIANLTNLFKFDLIEPINVINNIDDNEDIYINVNETININDTDIEEFYNDIISSDGTIDAPLIMGKPLLSKTSTGRLGSKSKSSRIKYYKKFFNKSDYKKNIINLHKEWLEILKNYKNKLENKILIGGGPPLHKAVSAPSILNPSLLNIDSKISSPDDRQLIIADLSHSGSSSKDISELIQVFIEYENKVREFKKLSNDIIKLVKLYNVRYVQFIHFQNWITRYIEETITNGVYGYYKYIGLGQISYNAKILLELKNKLEKFNITESLNKDDLEIIQKDIYRKFYKFHFFIINILENFFRKLEEYWKINDFNVHSLIKTKTENQEISNYFFLFNIFETTLSDYRINYFKKVANYIRINQIPDRIKPIISFKKDDNSSKLSLVNLRECKDFIKKYGPEKLDDISKIKFEEVFDEENFKENNKIAQYIGISDMLKRLSSTMILTYGYSGTGKTFTIFGSSQKDGKSPIDGMLQSILKKLGSGITIQVKTFELYGLGVPYKFYWKDSSKIDHHIYSYPYSNNDITPIPYYNIAGVNKKRDNVDNNFTEYLKPTNDYRDLDTKDIANFSDFIDKINKIRKKNGRIKQTLNNPESSRGILFCDFKITINKNEVNLVIADIPGKEKIKETYCDDYNITVKTDYKNFKFYDISGTKLTTPLIPPDLPPPLITPDPTPPQTPRAPAAASEVDEEEDIVDVDDNVTISSEEHDPSRTTYNEKLLKLLIFSNPLWLSMIPETAEVFDMETFPKAKKDKNTTYPIKTLLEKEPNIKLQIYNVTIENTKSFFKKSEHPIKHSDKGLKFFDNDKKRKYSPYEKRILKLRGLKERALFRIVNLIENDLEGLGLILNEMVDNEYKNKNQGYAGLEAVYINENIGCILQILSNKIKKDKGLNDKIPIFCEQQNYYSKKILEKTLDRNLHQNVKKNNLNNIADDEFYSLIHYLNTYEKKNFIDSITTNIKSEGLFNLNNIYKNKFRLITDNDFNEGPPTDDLIKYEDDSYISLLNIYNYDRLFNIKEPSIEYILKPYIDKIKNFYLLFVVTNSNKKDETNICKEQNELLYETINFMKVIDDPNFIPELKCE